MSIEQTTQVMSRLTPSSHNVASPSKSEQVVAVRQDQAIDDGKSVPVNEQSQVESQKEQEQARVNQAVSDLNDFVQNIQRSVHFSVDEDSGQTVVRVIDRETDELIRQIPSEEILNIARSLEEQIAANKGEGLILQVQA